MISSRVPAHGFIMGKSPDFPYLCVYKSICQRLAFACKSCIHRRFICGCKGLHVVFYTLEQKKKRLTSVHYVCYILIVSYLFVKVNGVLRKCRRSRNGSLCHAIFLSPPLSMAVTNYLQNRAFTI